MNPRQVPTLPTSFRCSSPSPLALAERNNLQDEQDAESARQMRTEAFRLEEEAKENGRQSSLICSGGDLPRATSPVLPAERELYSIEKNHFM